MKIVIPSLVGYAAEDASEQETSAKIGFKIKCKDNLPGVKPVLINSVLDEFVYPEIMARIKEEKLTPQFRPSKVHIVMYNDNLMNEVLLNDEVRFIGLTRLRKKDRSPGEPISEQDIEDILEIYPSEQNDPNAAHIMMFRFRGDWLISCDFFYNRDRNRKKLENAISFLKAAKMCETEKLYGPLVECTFGATELAIQSILLFQPLGKFAKRQSHPSTSKLFENYTSLGNLDKKYWDHYRRLRDLRLKGRYLHGIHGGMFSLDSSKSKGIIDTTQELIEYVAKLMVTIDFSKPHDGEYIAFGNFKRGLELSPMIFTDPSLFC